MKIADFLRGVENVGVAAVDGVFSTAESALQGVPFLPSNIKADLVQTVKDAKTDFDGVVGLANTLAGNVAADAVDDLTTLLLNTAGAVAANGTDLSKLGAAEKTVLLQTWTAMKAQGDTLVAQLHAGLNPAATKAPAPAPVNDPQPAAA